MRSRLDAGMIPVMSTPVLPLEYATAQAVMDPAARRAFGEMLLLSILSGLCVGVCFLSLTANMFAAALHVAVFIATITLAIRSGRSLGQLTAASNIDHRPRMVLDLLAGMGLVIIGLAPIFYVALENSSGRWIETFGAIIMGIAYSLLAGTTIRHRMLYKFLADVCRQSNHPFMARRLIALGWGKTVYEGLWLALCAAALLLIGTGNVRGGGPIYENIALWCAFGALFGAMGFGAIWIWMIIIHAVLFRLTRTG